MQTFDYIVVGSGITGLTAARVLAQHGHHVLLLEKATILGGSMARFRIEGIPYDVGFHFTGGFDDTKTGVLDTMLRLLGVREQIRPIFFSRDCTHRMIFPTTGATYSVPSGTDRMRETLAREFPGDRDGLDKYFVRFQNVVKATPTLELTGFDDFPPPISEDFVTLQSVLDAFIKDPILKTILGGLCMCYGTRPDQVSFGTHARVSWGLQESLARVESGGDAFVDALVDQLKSSRVDIRTRTTIVGCEDFQDKKVGRFVLSDGSEVSAKACIFTIHPDVILDLLPKEHLSKAFKSRVGDFKPSNAFFTVYGAMDTLLEESELSLSSILPDPDLNKLLTYSDEPVQLDGAMMVLRSREQGNAGPVQTVTALEVAFIEATQQWKNTKLKRRPPEYYEYKRERTESIMGRMKEFMPECNGTRVIDSASSLTYRDYLHSPDGSAYGIQQTMGQFNVVGRLPIRNIYAAGQSALLPGVIGSMMSALVVCRNLLGQQTFAEYLAGSKCH